MVDPVINVSPFSGGRVVRWKAKCSACGGLGERQGKHQAEVLAIQHADEVHEKNASVRTRR